MNFTTDIEHYIKTHTSEGPVALNEIFRRSNLSVINPRMVSGHIQGMLLSLLSKFLMPSKILEIGTFTGYSAVCLAQGLTANGVLHTIEVNDEIAEKAAENFQLAGLGNSIKLHIGNALNIIPTLGNNFDLVFIDAEKREYPAYFNCCKNIVRRGGLIIADNVLWDGKVVDSASQNDEATKAVMEFNNLVHNDSQFENLLLPLRDGLMLARKI